uniref:ATP synthase complex subunit 8 n=1 Tax=Pseudothemis zonata TaxID=257050 RepID=A0A7M1I7I6_9ODON|nr:ATP synthase F0 subunit 8 [Pseudothemis zonata]QOQ35033.1 ATP synthase F0 subunit 8 [Pseudothemis zonata]
MPQMAPMSWIMLFIFFSLMLVIINILNYYLFNPKITLTNNDFKSCKKKMNWLW